MAHRDGCRASESADRHLAHRKGQHGTKKKGREVIVGLQGEATRLRTVVRVRVTSEEHVESSGKCVKR